ncbi:MAG: phosphoglycerate kinase [Saprospiraceae bacterium]
MYLYARKAWPCRQFFGRGRQGKRSKGFFEKCKRGRCKSITPRDSVCADKSAADANVEVFPSKEIPDGWMGLDIGPSAARSYARLIRQSKHRHLEWSNGCI